MTGLEMDVIPGSTPFSDVKVSGVSLSTGSSGEDSSKNGQLHVVLHPFTKQRSEWRSLVSCSGGERELLMVLSAVNLSGATNVFLDEPGHSLHPPKQAQLRRWLAGRDQSDQVIFVITHSTEMISPEWLGCLYHMLLEKDDKYTACCLRGKQKTRESKSGKKEGRRRRKEAGRNSHAVIDENHEDQSDEEPHTKIRRLSGKELSSHTISFLMGAEMRRLFFSAGVIFVEGDSDRRVIQALRHVALRNADDVLEKSQSSIKGWYNAYLETRMDRWDIIPMNGCAEWLKAYSAAECLGIPFLILLDADVLTVKQGSSVVPMTYESWRNSRLWKSVNDSEYKSNNGHQLTKMVEAVDELANSRKPDKADLVRDEIKKCHVWVLEKDLEHLFFKNESAQKKLMVNQMFQEVLKDLQLTSSNQPSSHTPRDRPCKRARGGQRTEGIESCFEYFKQSSEEIECKFTKLIEDTEKSSANLDERVTKLAELIPRKAGEVKQKMMNYNKSQRASKKDSSEHEKLDWLSVKKKFHKGGWKNVSFELLQEMVKVALEAESNEYLGELSDDGRKHYDRHGLRALWQYVKDQLITENEKLSIPTFVFEEKVKGYV